jgi:hypothetical protein
MKTPLSFIGLLFIVTIVLVKVSFLRHLYRWLVWRMDKPCHVSVPCICFCFLVSVRPPSQVNPVLVLADGK